MVKLKCGTFLIFISKQKILIKQSFIKQALIFSLWIASAFIIFLFLSSQIITEKQWFLLLFPIVFFMKGIVVFCNFHSSNNITIDVENDSISIKRKFYAKVSSVTSVLINYDTTNDVNLCSICMEFKDKQNLVICSTNASNKSSISEISSAIAKLINKPVTEKGFNF